ncbi:MAG: putative oxidoreductase YdbC [bacterium ADurb.Bin425]|nr:MAG: putative oxidoreductase YdbC [bacterium ADurb.Bin425]
MAVVKEIGKKYGASPAQVALAYVLSRDPQFVPIPGTKRARYLEENVEALSLQLSKSDLEELGNLSASGARYDERRMSMIER